jgi:Sec-independent protein translocase protein TatA
MNIKRDSISELKVKLANTMNVIRDGKKAARKFKKRMADFVGNDKSDSSHHTENPKETDRNQKQGESEASEETKERIRYSDYEIATDNDEEIRIISPDKNGKPPLEPKRDLKRYT